MKNEFFQIIYRNLVRSRHSMCSTDRIYAVFIGQVEVRKKCDTLKNEDNTVISITIIGFRTFGDNKFRPHILSEGIKARNQSNPTFFKQQKKTNYQNNWAMYEKLKVF